MKESRVIRVSTLLVAGLVFHASHSTSWGASYQTRNFIVWAATPELAEQAGLAAERHRREIATDWLRNPLPNWNRPCQLYVRIANREPWGRTTFSFDRGQVFDWVIRVEGPVDAVLNSVLPHEISHAILASHFRRPVPRWADEGVATMEEDPAEQRRQKLAARQMLQGADHLELRRLLDMREYPQQMSELVPLYAQGFALAQFLVEKGGKPRLVKFLTLAQNGDWDTAVRKTYGFRNVEALNETWIAWMQTDGVRQATSVAAAEE